MPPFATNNTICYDPLTSTTSTSTSTSTTSPTVYTTIGPTSISFTYENTEEKMKEYCDKVDQHVDKLEEDIEFFNNKRLTIEEHVEYLINQNIQKDTKIKELEDTITNLKSFINFLDNKINDLEAKVINEN